VFERQKKKSNGGGMVVECVRCERKEWEARGKYKTLIFVIKKLSKMRIQNIFDLNVIWHLLRLEHENMLKQTKWLSTSLTLI